MNGLSWIGQKTADRSKQLAAPERKANKWTGFSLATLPLREKSSRKKVAQTDGKRAGLPL
jgi:hypothetical protein